MQTKGDTIYSPSKAVRKDCLPLFSNWCEPESISNVRICQIPAEKLMPTGMIENQLFSRPVRKELEARILAKTSLTWSKELPEGIQCGRAAKLEKWRATRKKDCPLVESNDVNGLLIWEGIMISIYPPIHRWASDSHHARKLMAVVKQLNSRKIVKNDR